MTTSFEYYMIHRMHHRSQQLIFMDANLHMYYRKDEDKYSLVQDLMLQELSARTFSPRMLSLREKK